MHESEVIRELLLVIAAAAVGAAVFERLRLPAIAGFLVTGAIVGPGGLGFAEDPDRIRALAELGVAFLLFEIGLELPVEELRAQGRGMLAAGALQVLGTLGVVALAGVALGLRPEAAVVMGMLVSLSSTALVMRILRERDEVDAPHGRLSLGILLFQDLCIVPFLLAVPILSGAVPRDPVALALAVGKALAASAALYAGARFVFPWLLERVVRLRSPDLFSLAAFLLAIGSAVLAEVLGLTLAVGAFVAGLVVSASPWSHQLFAEVAPLRGVLLGVFFTAVGMLLDPRAVVDQAPSVALYVAAVVGLKSLLIVAVVAGLLGRGLRTGIQSGLALAQTGEFSFVLAAAAADTDLLPRELRQTFVAGSILTLLATPFLIRAAPEVARRVMRGAEAVRRGPRPEALRDHVVIVGLGLAGRTLARVLRGRAIPYRVVDANPTTVADARVQGEPILFGDATRPSILRSLGVERARMLVVVVNDPAATEGCVRIARALAPGLHIVARTRYMTGIDPLFEHGASQVVVEEFEASIDLVSKVLRGFDVPQQAVAHFAEELREEGYELIRGPLGLPLDPWLAELLEEVATEWVELPGGEHPERTIRELGIRAATGASILAVEREGRTTPNPPPDFALRPGDRLLVLAHGRQIASLRGLLGVEE